ncbi:hypothetical protein M8J77_017209 [Diaphorina citri]|nr:hypothetical protein M8J77_017209 [Diaphorina citri]
MSSRLLLLLVPLLLFYQLNITGCVQQNADQDEDEDEDDDTEEDKQSFDDDRVYKNPRNFPSPECPRDEARATFMGQKCLRKCSSDEDCKSKKKKCLCDGSCGMSCIKPERECEDLTNPGMGTVHVSGRLFSDKAVYSCEPGYNVVGPKERVCQADGSWSGPTPTCKQNLFCGLPPVINHARVNAASTQTTFDIGATIHYQCDPGFVTKGFQSARCHAKDSQNTATWFGPDISCDPKSCGDPPTIAHGSHEGSCYTVGCKVNYTCEVGFQITGKSEHTCLVDGNWYPKELPVCLPVQCATPDSPVHGKAIYTSTSYNSVVSYECNYGYTLEGQSKRQCGADKKWSGQMPKCQEINCAHPGPIHNGWIENIESGTGLGASLIFRCHSNMIMLGNSSSVCQSDGTWRYPPPLCMAPCVVPAISHGKVSLLKDESINITAFNSTPVSYTGDLTSQQLLLSKANEPTMVQHGEQLGVYCENMYEPAPSVNNTPVQCSNGTWTHIPKCQPARCKVLPKVPRHGMVIAPKTDHGMRALFKCKDGFELRGENTTLCQYGEWVGASATCIEVYCPFPGYVENGRVMLVGSMGIYDYRPYVKKITNNKQIMYECEKNFVLSSGPPGATCIGGHWSPSELPKCTPGQHPRIRSKREARLRRLRRRNKRALSGQNSQAMRKQMTKSDKDKDKNNAIDTKDGRRNQQTEEEDILMGAIGPTGKKGKNGKKKFGRKKSTPCEEIPDEPQIEIIIEKPGKDDNVTYSNGVVVKINCSEGYQSNLGTDEAAKCMRGRWKPVKPACVIPPCVVPLLSHGSYVLPSNASDVEIQHNETIHASCIEGFIIQGPPSLSCSFGQWTAPSLPECFPAPCSLPEISNGHYTSGYRAGLTIGNGSTVTFQCDNEYVPSTFAPIECFLGILLPRNPGCKRDPHLYVAGSDMVRRGEIGAIDDLSGLRGSCSPPSRVSGSLVYKNGVLLQDKEKNFPDGTEVTFNCVGSIMGESISWRIACVDGQWIGRSLSCEDIQNSIAAVAKDNTSCIFANNEPNVLGYLGDKQIREENVEFAADTVLMFRCIDIGKYQMTGSKTRKCVNGEWDGDKATCFGLNQENDYAFEKPPTILLRHQLGPIAQSNDGKLIVYPGTILHMECLWIRRFGTPKWNISHEYRKYPEGWTSDPGRDAQLEYRLSIFHATKDDSGTYTCITPTRHTHSIEVVVKAVHCPPLPSRWNLIYSSTDTRLNTEVNCSCEHGNSLIGAPQLLCLPSGNWSYPVPSCESIECPDLSNLSDPNLRAAILSRHVGGQVLFSCTQGFGLSGPSQATCLPTGEWAQPFPSCSGKLYYFVIYTNMEEPRCLWESKRFKPEFFQHREIGVRYHAYLTVTESK